ncbi:MAG: hypothetical protein M0018_11820 [Nitrospiraceae bacterium]|nr:hypothetical protein [Nitrospiraceae bacterium]
MKKLVIIIIIVLWRPVATDVLNLVDYCVSKSGNNTQLYQTCLWQERAAGKELESGFYPKKILDLCRKAFPESYSAQLSCAKQKFALH